MLCLPTATDVVQIAVFVSVFKVQPPTLAKLQFRRRKSITLWPIEEIIVLSLLVTLCANVFLGINRGEITRLWIYLAVLFQIPAASFIGKMPSDKVMLFLVTSTLIIQAIITLQRVQFINPG